MYPNQPKADGGVHVTATSMPEPTGGQHPATPAGGLLGWIRSGPLSLDELALLINALSTISVLMVLAIEVAG